VRAMGQLADDVGGYIQPESRAELPFWRDRPTLITGGTGFLGRWLSRALAQMGANVICLSREAGAQPDTGLNGLSERVRMIRGDVRDSQCIEKILSQYGVDTIFHLAAQAIVGVANREPLETLETNVAGTWRLLEACRRTKTIKHIVFASSDRAYGDQPNLPYHEKLALDGVNPYEVSKSCSDLVARSYASTYGLPIVITRCANLFGGGDLNFNRIIPGTVRHILQGRRPVIRSDGRFVRDYLYVEDAVSAYVMLAEQLSRRDELVGQAFNFSNEVRISVLDLVRQVANKMGSRLEPLILNETVHEVRDAYLSSEKAREFFGWRPFFSQDEALRRTIDWYGEFLKTADA
jgi:CDP-glucose 4,6-dehydratase